MLSHLLSSYAAAWRDFQPAGSRSATSTPRKYYFYLLLHPRSMPGKPTQISPLLTTVPVVTTAPAATIEFFSITASSMTVAPIPIRQSS
eukprot:5549007-Ditylum_brightwellii.AAC.1